MPTWDTRLRRAARSRERVRLVDGREGMLVYAPAHPSDTPKQKPLRHGDRTKCGVAMDGDKPGKITAIDPLDITDILEEEEQRG